MEDKKINVVMLDPGKYARVATIDGSLEGMQAVVDGYIEAVYPFDDNVCIICNDEGKINGSGLNRALYRDGEVYDIIAGTAFVCGCGDESFESLSDEQLMKYVEYFKCPERFFMLSGKVVAERYDPS